MLVLTRGESEGFRIVVPPSAAERVVVVKVSLFNKRKKNVRLSIDAELDIRVIRSEIEVRPKGVNPQPRQLAS